VAPKSWAGAPLETFHAVAGSPECNVELIKVAFVDGSPLRWSVRSRRWVRARVTPPGRHPEVRPTRAARPGQPATDRSPAMCFQESSVS